MALRRATALLHISIACSVIAAVAFGIVPFGDIFGSTKEKAFTIVVASLFWISTILGQVFFWKANSLRKRIEKRAFNGRKLVHPAMGIKTFFSNKEARIFDIAQIISLFSFLLLSMVGVKHWIHHLCITVVLLSLYLHCIFNGRTYRYIKAFHKIKKGANRNENSRKVYE